jgi:hypothetical protein
MTVLAARPRFAEALSAIGIEPSSCVSISWAELQRALPRPSSASAIARHQESISQKDVICGLARTNRNQTLRPLRRRTPFATSHVEASEPGNRARVSRLESQDS